MGKTKVNIISGEIAAEDSGKAAYEKKKAARAAKKTSESKVSHNSKSVTPEDSVVTKPRAESEILSNLEPAEGESKDQSPQTEGSSRGKRYRTARAKVENKAYPVSEAVKLVQETSISRFPGSVELHLVLNEGTVNNRVELPYSTGVVKKIEIADDKTVEKLKTGTIDFDVLLASPAMMPKLVPFAKLLGPKGLMPNPKNGTVVENPEKAAATFGGNSVTVRTEKSVPLVHLVVAKVNQPEKEIEENIKAVFNSVDPKRLKKAVISPSMGPGIQVQVA